jgi:cyclophilin family peptidyl-prolyl cis-trans isomerase
MAVCATKGRRAGAWVAWYGLVLAAAFLGCHRAAPPAPQAQDRTDTGAEPAPAAPAPPAIDPRLTQSFAEATRKDPPPNAPRPPDTTLTSKSVGKLYTDVVRLWKDIPFVNAAGQRVEYSATIETDAGTIELALLSDVAPNHVRNFVALARSGYYDGLMFDRIYHQVSDVDRDVRLDMIEGGGPLGADDLEDHDSIGYWLKPETDPKVVHEEGSLGAVHGEELDSAACKFYIVLNKAPALLNGNYTVFGKVTRGLDVVRTIHQQPRIEVEEETGYSRPEKPVIIRKVTVHSREVDNPGARGENKKD